MREATPPANVADMALCCLIVDDNPGFLQSARILLEREGLRVVAVASTSEDALHRIEELRPDVVLVDVHLGDENGFDVVCWFHDRLGPSTPDLILISINTEEDLGELIAESPALGFISKSRLSASSIHALLEGRTLP